MAGRELLIMAEDYHQPPFCPKTFHYLAHTLGGMALQEARTVHASRPQDGWEPLAVAFALSVHPSAWPMLSFATGLCIRMASPRVCLLREPTRSLDMRQAIKPGGCGGGLPEERVLLLHGSAHC